MTRRGVLEPGFTKATSQNLPKVDVAMLVSFLSSRVCQSVEMRGVKQLRSTRSNYGDKAVGWVQLKRDGNRCIIKAEICPEHKVRQQDYSLLVIIQEEKDVILKAVCADCAASKGGCKHASAFIAWLHRRSEEPSPTEVTCYWKKSILSGVGSTIKCMTIKEIANEANFKGVTHSASDIKDPQSVKIPPPLNYRQFFRRILQRGLLDNSQAHLILFYQLQRGWQKCAMHHLACTYHGDSTKIEEFIDFLKKSYTYEDCAEVERITKNQNEASEWYELRYGRITASNVYEAAHCRTKEGSLHKKILGGKTFDTMAMARGRELESSVLKTVEKIIGDKISSSGLLLSPQYPCFGASPDGLTATSVIEVKCPSKTETIADYIQNDSINSKFKAQLQLQMAFAGKQKAWFCIADPTFTDTGKVFIIQEDYDVQYTANLLEQAINFWSWSIFPALMQSTLVKHHNRNR